MGVAFAARALLFHVANFSRASNIPITAYDASAGERGEAKQPNNAHDVSTNLDARSSSNFSTRQARRGSLIETDESSPFSAACDRALRSG
jgi:hypothetical protein